MGRYKNTFTASPPPFLCIFAIMKKNKANLVYGKHPVVDAIKAGKSFEKVWIQQGLRGELEREMRQLCKQFDIPLQYLPKERMNRLTSGANHQGVAGMVALVQYQQIENVLPMLFEKPEPPLVVVLDGVTDTRNFGAIARSAEVLGAQAIVVAQKNAAPVNPDAMKTSAGALAHLPICRASSISRAMEELRLSGLQLVGTSLQARQGPETIDFTLPTALFVGAEDTGLSPAVARQLDVLCRIPQSGKMDSLNVSVATGILLYEALRQKRA